MTTWNGSMIRDAQKCPRYCAYAHVQKRRKKNAEGMAQAVGSMFHKVAEFKDLNGRIPTELEMVLMAPSTAVLDEWKKFRLWVPLEAEELSPEWEIVGTELALEAPLDGGELVNIQGRLDRLVKVDGGYWSYQRKTYARDLTALVQKVELGWHESFIYPYLAEMNGYTPFKGTILAATKKLPSYHMVEQPDGKRKKVEVTDKDRVWASTLHWIAVKPELYKRRMTQIEAYGPSLLRQVLGLSENPDACFGPYGNSKCQYFDVCHGGESITDDTLFENSENRYADLEETE